MVCKRVQAGFTVEASFIIPLTFYIVFALLYVAFYLYDMTVLQNCLAESVWEQNVQEGYSFSSSRKKQEKRAIEERFAEKTTQALHVLEIENIKVSAETLYFQMDVSVRLHITLPGSKVFLQGPTSKKKVVYKRKRICPMEFARAYKGVGEVITEAKGANEAEKRREEGGKDAEKE